MSGMNFKVITTVFFLIFISLISGCKSTAVRNVEEAAFVVSANISLGTIKQAIIRGSEKAGWRAKAMEPGVLVASYSYKRNRFGAVVKIKYDRDSYEIIYHSSHNLKYRDNVASENELPGFLSESRDFFSENNPFKKENELSGSTEKPATIHKIYNKWVAELETKINAELVLLSKKKYIAKASVKANRNQSASCDDVPDYGVSGNGIIARSSVNVRQGAGTHCKIVTTVTYQDVFTLLGKKNNWYYVALSRGGHGWIYAPLVSRPEEKTQRVVTETSRVSAPPAIPTPPLVPTKSISIAVIR
ncbi:MAG: SH3 domain-containing protein, partial [Methylococcaceae bacterium]|nr:SH3 domain-containing protein [Methylococcaceae bacterium]